MYTERLYMNIATGFRCSQSSFKTHTSLPDSNHSPSYYRDY
jgi:hypothetical protein